MCDTAVRLIITDIQKLIGQIKAGGISLRRRFVLYIISAIALVLSLIIFLLNMFGIMNPVSTQVINALDTQLLSYADRIQHDYDKLAAHSISFSKQIEATVQKFLTKNGIAFEDLKNNSDFLSALQEELYATVYLNMQLAPSSGVFYILDTTVNSHSDTRLFNGIYLKYINLNSENTVNNEIALYRGSFTTAKTGNLTFHSGWSNEMHTSFFDRCESEFTDGVHYILSPTVEIPGTWERARYVYVPIRDPNKNIIGVCGFEVNDLYFQLSKKANDGELGQLIGALLDEKRGVYSGQFNSNRYNSEAFDSVIITEKKGTTVFDLQSEKCIGRSKSITLGKDTFTVALMITEAQFGAYFRRGQITTTVIIFIVILVALAYCFFISKKYVAPVLRQVEQIKQPKKHADHVKIREIDDLFTFLAEKDTAHEEQLKALNTAKHAAEEETRRTKLAYEKALKEYELAQNEILHLTEKQTKKIDLEDYEYFICNLKTLTPTETRIYELYLDGKSAQEISDILSIQENTMKYHNKNIYSKLGVSSRKQLLRFAALKQHQDSPGSTKT